MTCSWNLAEAVYASLTLAFQWHAAQAALAWLALVSSRGPSLVREEVSPGREVSVLYRCEKFSQTPRPLCRPSSTHKQGRELGILGGGKTPQRAGAQRTSEGAHRPRSNCPAEPQSLAGTGVGVSGARVSLKGTIGTSPSLWEPGKGSQSTHSPSWPHTQSSPRLGGNTCGGSLPPDPSNLHVFLSTDLSTEVLILLMKKQFKWGKWPVCNAVLTLSPGLFPLHSKCSFLYANEANCVGDTFLQNETMP